MSMEKGGGWEVGWRMEGRMNRERGRKEKVGKELGECVINKMLKRRMREGWKGDGRDGNEMRGCGGEQGEGLSIRRITPPPLPPNPPNADASSLAPHQHHSVSSNLG